MNNFTKLILSLCFLISFNAVGQPFITKWDLSIPGSGATQLSFGVGTTGVVNYTWETIPAGTNGAGTFTGTTATISGLPAGAMIRLSIDSAHFNRIVMASSSDANRLLDVEQWGTIKWASMLNAFAECTFLNCTTIDVPNLSNVTTMNSMFFNCTSLNGPLNINSWNVSNVQSMNSMFRNAISFNQPLGSWNTGNVVWMFDMFNHADLFNQPIGNWNTGNVQNMDRMFASAVAFNQPIGNWNTSSVTSMEEMFLYTPSFNQPLGNWNTSAVTNMKRMFNMSPIFNQQLNTWDVSQVTDMQSMFCMSYAFNQPLDNWNTSSVQNMFDMFGWAYAFNQPIGTWNTSNVKDMGYMFRAATSFNQPIGSWNTANVENMDAMFFQATSFNQPIGSWNMSNVLSTSMMFREDSLFNQDLSNWDIGSDTNTSYMFYSAIIFNYPVFSWDVSSLKKAELMFGNAISFNQSLGNWNLPQHVNLQNSLSQCGLDCSNYSSTLVGWNSNPNTPDSINLGLVSLHYGMNVQSDHDNLINIKGWIILGDTLSNTNCCVVQHTMLTQTSCQYYFFNGQNLTTSGTYYDTLLNVNGCDSIISLNLTINQVNTSMTQSGANLSANASAANYQWLSCNPYQIISGATNQTFTANANGDYAVIVTENGCTDTSACITVMGIGLDEYSNDDKIIVYPNPAQDRIYVTSTLSDNQNTKKELYNTLGQVILTTYENEIDVSGLVKGVYYIRCGQFVEKVIVE